MAQEKHSDTQLGTESIWRLILRMGIPGLVAQLINLLYNLVDRMYIGHIPEVGQLALTGVGLTLPALQIISAFSSLVGNGGAPLAAIALGKGDRERAERILGNGLVVLLCFSAALTALFLGIRRPFLYMVGASDATYPYANDYIVIYLAGTVFVQLTLGLNPFITAQGQSRVAMLSILIGAAINIALDPLFIFALNMGVRGAALATVLSQAASAAWITWFLCRRDTSLRIRRDRLRPRAAIIAGVAALGVSPFIMSSTESLISIVLSSGLSRYGGDLYVGSLTILQSVMQLISIPMGGFTGGVAPIMSYNYGAGRPDRVRAAFLRLLAIGFSYSFLIALAAMVVPTAFARIFTSNADLIALVGRVLPIFIAGMLIFGVQNVCQTAFMALGQAKRSLLIALLRKVILLAPLAAVLPAITQNVMSIYWAEPIADVLSATTCLTVFGLFVRKGGFGGAGASSNR
ncbi:MAG: MATE family efflux transporter [Candidatus Faecivicinus sp.]